MPNRNPITSASGSIEHTTPTPHTAALECRGSITLPMPIATTACEKMVGN
jgi:hypothetical protein